MKGTMRMGATRANWRVRAVRAAGVAVATLGVCGPAHAFYWYDWPGSRLKVPPTLITPSQNTLGNPPVPPSTEQAAPPGSTHVPPPPGGPTGPIDLPPGGPNPTPEPATGLMGLLGLGALAAVRRWRSGGSRKS